VLEGIPLAASLEPSQTLSFVLSSGANWLQSLALKIIGTADFIAYRREGTTTWLPNVYDSTGNSTNNLLNIFIPNPRMTTSMEFVNMITILNSNSFPMNITVDAAVAATCPEGKGGDGCTSIANLSPLGSYFVTPSDLSGSWYFGLISFTGSSFKVGLRGFGGKTPHLYLRFGNIPSLNDFDSVDNASTTGARYYDSGVTNITGTWYLGVYLASGTSGDFGLWFNDNCPNQCSGHGECSNHVCACYSGYSNWNCASGNGVGGGDSQRDLIIGVCVGIGALLVLIGALYWRGRRKPRRRRNSYDYLRDRDDEPSQANYLTIGTL